MAFNVGLLGLFKYAYFMADWWPNSTLELGLQSWRLDQWMLPIGLSFFTFQAISYVLDVHRGTLKAPASLLSFATYLSFFPQLVAGPIVRARQFLPQLDSISWMPAKEEDRQHIQMILTGFLKKILLGDFIGAWIVDPVFAEPAAWSSVEIWIALYGYSLQVYADFSGYTDMATGMAGLLGIALPENFRRPYQATSPGDFWRRWHITLSAWWKDYVYIPMGGNRRFSPFSLGCLALAFAAIVWHAGNLGVSLVTAGVTFLLMAVLLLYPAGQSPSCPCHQRVLDHVVGRTLARSPHEFHRLGRPEWRGAERVDCAPTALRKEVGCMAWLAGHLSHCGGFPNLVQGRFPRSHE